MKRFIGGRDSFDSAPRTSKRALSAGSCGRHFDFRRVAEDSIHSDEIVSFKWKKSLSEEVLYNLRAGKRPVKETRDARTHKEHSDQLRTESWLQMVTPPNAEPQRSELSIGRGAAK